MNTVLNFGCLPFLALLVWFLMLLFFIRVVM